MKTKPTPEQATRAKIADRLFEAHSSINRAIGYSVERIMNGADISDELVALHEQLAAIVVSTVTDCEKIRKDGL